MAQGTRTWTELIGLTAARCGCALSGDDATQVAFLLNSAARQLYLENPWWERFLVLEPRTVERGYVSYSEDSFNVYGAGTSEANGLYVRNGDDNGKGKWTFFNADEVSLFDIKWDDEKFVLTRGAFYDGTEFESEIVYNSSVGAVDLPPETSWTSDNGEDPTPIVQALSEIGEYIGHWNGKKWSGANPTMGTAYPDQNGIRVTDSSQDIVYMAFKKSFNTTYGDGTSGTTSDVPAEWFEFMAYSAARSFMQSQRQSDSYQPIAISEVERVREQALLKINRQGIYKTIAQRFRTYYNQDVSIH
jgi:hypothetical protein